MGDAPEIDEIREREAQGDDDDGDGDGDDAGGLMDGAGGLLDGVGLTRRQLLLVAVVVAAVLLWYARSRADDGDGENAREQVEDMRDADLGDVTVTEQEDQEGVEVRVPADPDDELEKDAAIIDYFKEAGHMTGDDD